MSQTNLFINPSADNGIDLANKLNSWKEAIHSSHNGVDRPQYAEAGMFWVCEKSESLWEWYLFDGNQDVLICTFNPIDSSLKLSGASSISIEETPPANPNPGDLWFESDSGNLYISYINPGDLTRSWVATGGSSGEPGTGAFSVPVGTITMWGGDVADIHPNWAVCDGQYGTPDLRDRFIVGAGSFYEKGQTGGRSSVQLTVDEMPSHTHTATAKATRMTGTTSGAGGHNHTLSDPGHFHGPFPNSSGYITHGAAGTYSHIAGINPGGGFSDQGVGSNPSTAAAGTGMWMDAVGDHSHTFSIDVNPGGVNISATGGGQAFDITPKFFALCYVMKVIPDGAEFGKLANDPDGIAAYRQKCIALKGAMK